GRRHQGAQPRRREQALQHRAVPGHPSRPAVGSRAIATAVIGLVFAAVTAAFALAAFETLRSGRRRVRRNQRVVSAVGHPDDRPAVMRELRARLAHLDGGSSPWMGNRGRKLEAAEVRLSLALLLLVEDEPEGALDLLVAIHPDSLPVHLQALLAMHAIEAHL